MVRYQNLTRKPELFRAPLSLGPGTMYPPEPPLAGPANDSPELRQFFERSCVARSYSDVKMDSANLYHFSVYYSEYKWKVWFFDNLTS